MSADPGSCRSPNIVVSGTAKLTTCGRGGTSFLRLGRYVAVVGLSFLLASVAPLHGADVPALDVRLELADDATCSGSGTLRADELELEVSVPGSIQLTRRPDTLSLNVLGCWSPDAPQIDPMDQEVILTLWPTGHVGGAMDPTITVSSEHLMVRWVSAAPAPETAERPPDGSAGCSQLTGRWRCPIPAGRWDVRVSAHDLAPAFFWDVEVAAHRARDLGPLALHAGSRVSGVIAVEDGSPADVRVTLEPDLAVRSARQQRNIDLQALTTRSGDVGAFAFSGVPAGIYTLRFAGPPELSTRELRGLEVVNPDALRLEETITLKKKRWLEVEISPGFDPSLEPWKVRLSTRSAHAFAFRTHSELQADRGYVNFSDLDEGHYRAVLLDSKGQEVAARLIKIGADGDAYVTFELDFVAIEGSVRSGVEPIAGILILTSTAPNAAGGKIKLTTTDIGEFAGMLPQAGEWRAHFETGSQRIALPEPFQIDIEPTGATQLDIVLPGGRIEGRVVDEDGEGVDRVIVTALQGGRVLSQTRAGLDGAFRFLGLREGQLTLVCDASSSRGAGPLPVEIRDGKVSEIELELEQWRSVKLRLVTAGRPASGASVVIRDPRFGGRQTLRAGPSGVVETLLPPGQRRLGIFVRSGRSPRVMRNVPISESFDHATVELSNVGGLLVIPLRRDTMSQVLSHAGASFQVGELVSPGLGSLPQEIDNATGSFRLMVESGDYQLCRKAEEPICRSAYLAPNSLVELDLPFLEQDWEEASGSDI